MFFDPQCKTAIKPSLVGMAAWLETQDQNAEYPWSDCDGGCLIGLYVKSIGFPWNETVKERADGTRLYEILTACNAPLHLRCIALSHPHTFGGALARTRAVLAYAEQAGK